MTYNIKNKNTFFSPGEVETGGMSSGDVVVKPTTDSEKPVVLPYTSSKTKRKKRNLVSSMGPFIIKVTETKEIEYEKNGETVKEVVPYKINKSYNDILDAYLNDQTIKLLYKEKETTDTGTVIGLNIELLTDPKFVIIQISKYQFYTIKFNSFPLVAFSPNEPMVYKNGIQDELDELINGDNGEQEVIYNPTPGKVTEPDPGK